MKQFYEKVRELLEKNNFEEGVYHCCQHTCGIPGGTHIKVKPEYSPIDGAYTLVITPTHVKRYTCGIPFNHHDWRMVGSTKYSSPEELLTILNKYAKEEQGCW